MAANPSAGECGVEDQVGRASATHHAGSVQSGRSVEFGHNRPGRGIEMEVIVRGRHLTVPARFRQHAAAKLAKLEKLGQEGVRIDVEVSAERNPRQSDRRERVELTIRSRGPAIRAEAAADDRYAALDLALGKLESRLRRANDRRNARKCDHASVRLMTPDMSALAELSRPNGSVPAEPPREEIASPAGSVETADPVVPIEMEGDG